MNVNIDEYNLYDFLACRTQESIVRKISEAIKLAMYLCSFNNNVT